MFFTITLAVGFSLVIICNMLFAFSFQTALNLLISYAIVLVPAALWLYVSRVVPTKYCNGQNFPLKDNKFKQYICKITYVKKWKDSIPVAKKVFGCHLDTLTLPKNVEFLNKFIDESCRAEIVHGLSFIWCFVSMIVCPQHLVLTMVLPIGLVFAYQNIVSVLIQWQIRPKICMLKKRIENRSENKSETSENAVIVEANADEQVEVIR